MNCLTVSDLSLLETLETRLQSSVSVTLLAELERELLRLRSEASPSEWRTFCSDFHKRWLKQVRKLAGPPHADIVGAWEYSLPASRSLRSRTAYFSREISEAFRTIVKPRILILGAGDIPEAVDALHAAHLSHAEFVALEPKPEQVSALRLKYSKYANRGLHVMEGQPSNLQGLTSTLGRFDLIYSAAWLDSCDDAEASEWLGAASEMLRAGGRLLAANFAPSSHDAGWIEACWTWHPHYRSEENLAHLVMNLKNPAIPGHVVFRDETGASAYLEVYSI